MIVTSGKFAGSIGKTFEKGERNARNALARRVIYSFTGYSLFFHCEMYIFPSLTWTLITPANELFTAETTRRLETLLFTNRRGAKNKRKKEIRDLSVWQNNIEINWNGGRIINRQEQRFARWIEAALFAMDIKGDDQLSRLEANFIYSPIELSSGWPLWMLALSTNCSRFSSRRRN